VGSIFTGYTYRKTAVLHFPCWARIRKATG
jgi:hypothetical protein